MSSLQLDLSSLSSSSSSWLYGTMDGGVLDDLIASATSLGTLLLAVREWNQAVSDMHTHAAEFVKTFLCYSPRNPVEELPFQIL
jgi:hypothetical protein